MNAIVKLSVTALVALLLSACGSNIIKPIPKDVIGNATVRRVDVGTQGSVRSETIASKVKGAVEKQAQKDLKGNRQIDLKISLDRWVGSEHIVGGSVTSKLLGSKTELNGTIDILDAKTGELLGKYTIAAKHEEGGLLSAQRTISLVDTDSAVIEKFALYTIHHLQ